MCIWNGQRWRVLIFWHLLYKKSFQYALPWVEIATLGTPYAFFLSFFFFHYYFVLSFFLYSITRHRFMFRTSCFCFHQPKHRLFPTRIQKFYLLLYYQIDNCRGLHCLEVRSWEKRREREREREREHIWEGKKLFNYFYIWIWFFFLFL